MEIRQTLCAMAEQVKLCKGCLDAYCLQDINDENVFYHVQEWESRKDLDDHLDSKLYAALLGLKSLLTDPLRIEFLYKQPD